MAVLSQVLPHTPFQGVWGKLQLSDASLLQTFQESLGDIE